MWCNMAEALFGDVQASVLYFSTTLFCAHAKIGALRTTAVTCLQQRKGSEQLFVYPCMLFAVLLHFCTTGTTVQFDHDTSMQL